MFLNETLTSNPFQCEPIQMSFTLRKNGSFTVHWKVLLGNQEMVLWWTFILRVYGKEQHIFCLMSPFWHLKSRYICIMNTIREFLVTNSFLSSHKLLTHSHDDRQRITSASMSSGRNTPSSEDNKRKLSILQINTHIHTQIHKDTHLHGF